MTPQELKNSILQLAIQGKLVEQRPEEGTAEELFARIQEEKQRLIAETKIKKEKSLPKINDDEKPFDIPESWMWVRWGNLSQSIQYGYNAPAHENGRIKMVRISDIQEGKVLWDSVPYCEIKEDDIPTYILEANDILFARTGGTVGKSYLVKEVPEAAIYAGYLIRTRYSSLLCPEYLKYFMESQLYWKQLRNGTIATAQPNCNGKTLSKMVLPLPPFAEQKRIVAKIEELLPYIDRYEQAWSKLEQFNSRFPEDMKKSLLQYAIQGKLVEQRPEEGTAEELFAQIQQEKQRLIAEKKIKKEKPLPEITDDEKPFDIPEGWMWVRLSQIWVVLNGDRGKNYPAKSKLSTTGIPFISAVNLDGKTVVQDERLLCLSQEQYNKLGNGKLEKNDVVVCIRGSLGKHGVYPFDKGAIASSLVILRNYYTAIFDNDFLLLYLDSPLFFQEIKKYDNGTAQPNLSAKSLEQFLIPLPPLVEQKRIVQKLDHLLPLCDHLM